nr:MAG TPA: hypothetical protein [Caudoviricetes sp.]
MMLVCVKCSFWNYIFLISFLQFGFFFRRFFRFSPLLIFSYNWSPF